jgi:hypothetical protein
VVLTTHPLLAPRSRECRAIPLPHSGLSTLLRGTFTFYLFQKCPIIERYSNPVEPWAGTERSRRSQISKQSAREGGKVSAFRTSRLYSPGNMLICICNYFCLSLVLVLFYLLEFDQYMYSLSLFQNYIHQVLHIHFNTGYVYEYLYCAGT